MPYLTKEPGAAFTGDPSKSEGEFNVAQEDQAQRKHATINQCIALLDNHTYLLQRRSRTFSEQVNPLRYLLRTCEQY